MSLPILSLIDFGGFVLKASKRLLHLLRTNLNEFRCCRTFELVVLSVSFSCFNSSIRSIALASSFRT
jgi:hypothetical protein